MSQPSAPQGNSPWGQSGAPHQFVQPGKGQPAGQPVTQQFQPQHGRPMPQFMAPGSTAGGPALMPPARPKKPFYKKVWVWVVAGLVGVGALASQGGGEPVADGGVPVSAASTSAAPAGQATAKVPAAVTTGPAGKASATAAASKQPEPQVPAIVTTMTEKYGSFAPVTVKGSGAKVIKLPAEAGIITAKHTGSSNFILNVLDADNQPTLDLLVNTIGSYSGTTAYGLSSLGAGVSLEVKADGPWTVTISPIGKAPVLSLPAKGNSDQVFLTDGPAATWKATHRGQGNFVIQHEAGGFSFGLLVNEIGSWSGEFAVRSGPAVVVVKADGSWTIANSN